MLAERLRDINPGIGLTVVDKYIKDEETYILLDAARYDYVVDAIDTLSSANRPLIFSRELDKLCERHTVFATPM